MAVRLTARPGAALVLFLGWVTLFLGRPLVWCREGDAYEWDKEHRVTVENDNSKGICFRKGTTTCVKYKIDATHPILAFVARKEDASDSLKGDFAVEYVERSVCRGVYCRVNVDVSKKHSYCLVILNRNNNIPAFSEASGKDVTIRFKVNGCSGTLGTIIGVVIVIVLLIAIFSCCVACCVHFVRKRDREQQAVQMASVVQVGQGAVFTPPPVFPPTGPPPPPHGQAQYPQVAVGTPQQQSIQFLEAKL